MRSHPTKTSPTRVLPVGFAAGQGNASAIDREVAVFGRAGWVDRLSEVDEAAVYGDLSRNWMQTGGYTEMTSASNPYPATVATGLDTLNVARLGAQYTRLFNDNIEVNVSGAAAYGFGTGSGATVTSTVSDRSPLALFRTPPGANTVRG